MKSEKTEWDSPLLWHVEGKRWNSIREKVNGWADLLLQRRELKSFPRRGKRKWEESQGQSFFLIAYTRRQGKTNTHSFQDTWSSETRKESFHFRFLQWTVHRTTMNDVDLITLANIQIGHCFVGHSKILTLENQPFPITSDSSLFLYFCAHRLKTFRRWTMRIVFPSPIPGSAMAENARTNSPLFWCVLTCKGDNATASEEEKNQRLGYFHPQTKIRSRQCPRLCTMNEGATRDDS